MTEEVWSWWQDGSIHRALVARASSELGDLGGDPATLDAVAAALIGIRGAKSQAKVSMRHELSAVEFSGPEAALDAVRLAEADLVRGGPDHGRTDVRDRRRSSCRWRRRWPQRTRPDPTALRGRRSRGPGRGRASPATRGCAQTSPAGWLRRWR